jgi:putative ABC transport system permease protein
LTAIWARLRAELRSGLRSLIALALLVGLFGGVTLASIAAARRTDSAYGRFIAANRPPQVFVLSGEGGLAGIPTVDLHRVLALPQVAEGRVVSALSVVCRTTDGKLLYNGECNVQYRLPGPVPYSAKLLEGRLPDPGRVDEIDVGYQAHPDSRVRVGSRIQLVVIRKGTDPGRAITGSIGRGDLLPPVTVKVVGVVLGQGELQGSADVYITPAFERAYQHRALTFTTAAIRLHHGLADAPAFQREVEGLTPGALSFTIGDEEVFVNRTTHLLAISVVGFAALAAVAGLLIIGQALIRRTFEESTENPRLRALGMTNRQLFGVAMLRTAMLGAAGAVLAVALAVGLSPLGPLGRLARLAEPHPGIAFDAAVLVAGAGVIVAVTLLVGILPAWRAARVRGGLYGSAELTAHGRPSAVATGFARSGFPPTAVTGLRMALEPGRGRAATPVRSAVIGAALSVAAVAAAMTVGASFGHLVDTPRLYGRTWDIDTGNPFSGPKATARIRAVLRQDPALTDLAAASIRDFIRVGEGEGTRVNVWAFQQIRGRPLHATVAEGRWPRSPTEIALGAKTLRETHAGIGDRIPVRLGTRLVTMSIVGRAVFPDGGFGPGLGEGAGLTLAGLHSLDPGALANAFGMNVAPGVDIESEARRLDEELGRYGAQSEGPSEGTQLVNLRRIEALPLLLSGVLALAAAAAVGHMLVTSVRRRRRDLAILKTLGFVRRQVSATVAWQATTVVLIALIVGVPLGLVAGRWTWSYFADQIGVVPEPVIALVPALLAIPAALVLANLVAAIPGRIAARTRPSVVLRTE